VPAAWPIQSKWTLVSRKEKAFLDNFQCNMCGEYQIRAKRSSHACKEEAKIYSWECSCNVSKMVTQWSQNIHEEQPGLADNNKACVHVVGSDCSDLRLGFSGS
jgi:hypothetical protein